MRPVIIARALEIAFRHYQAGEPAEAETICRQILIEHPEHPDALHLLGLTALRHGRNDIAADLIGRALKVAPAWAEAHYNLGIALQDQGKLADAAVAYSRAVQLKPDYVEAHFNLGTVLRDLRKLDEAIAAYAKAIALRPGYAEAYNNMGSALKDRGRLKESVDGFSRAIELNPGSAAAFNNLGNALRDQGKLAESVAALAKAIQLRPNFAAAFNNMGNALRDQGKLDESASAYLQAIALRPDYADAFSNLGNVRKDQGAMDEAIVCYNRAMALQPGNAGLHSNRLMAMHFHPAYDAAAIAAEHRRWNERHAARLRPARPEPVLAYGAGRSNSALGDGRLKIGYVSPDFRGHPVGRFLLPLLECHDYSQFEIFCYSDVRAPDGLTERLRARADVWRNMVGQSDEHVADTIRRDGIDILVDLTMHSADNRLLVFARKPAPVQITYLAYCSTSGLDAIDYRLTDPWFDPPALGDANYSEKSLHLPETYWCYQPSHAAPETGPLPALAAGQVTFGCLNSFAKVSPAALMTWCRLLVAVPQSRLVLHAKAGSHRQRALDCFIREGLDPQRVTFAGFVPAAEYLRAYNEIDIALDPFPFAGGTTTCDALWMGVPVVSLAGRTAVGRAGVSILSNLGLPELIADSPEQYIKIAGELAGNLPRLSELRAGLRERMRQSPLTDAPRFARHVEAAYRKVARTNL
jgi:predicted O-linked N-acetylglucosamine transferase (SPINDLY family)